MTLILLKTASRSIPRRPVPGPLRITKPQFTAKRHNATKPNAPAKAQENGTNIPVPNTIATLPLWQRLGPLSRAFERYANAQRKKPLMTQFISSLVIYFLGDMSAQSISGEDYDPLRTMRALIIGAGSSIPSYKWFIFLGNHFNFTSKLLSLCTKVLVNQLVFTPIFNSYFFGMQSLLSSLQQTLTVDLAHTWEHIKKTVPVSFVNSCKLWPAVTAFSFTFIGPQYRSIFAGVIAIGWQTYLSYLNTLAERQEAVMATLQHKDEPRGTEASRQVKQKIVET